MLIESLTMCVCVALQSSWPAGQYAAAVVAIHVVFALLEKQRLENFEEKGEVSTANNVFLLTYSFPYCGRLSKAVASYNCPVCRR